MLKESQEAFRDRLRELFLICAVSQSGAFFAVREEADFDEYCGRLSVLLDTVCSEDASKVEGDGEHVVGFARDALCAGVLASVARAMLEHACTR